MSDRKDASSDTMEHLREYQEDMCNYDICIEREKTEEDEEDADRTAVMIAYICQGHTVREWLLLLDDTDAYIEFLESLLAE